MNLIQVIWLTEFFYKYILTAIHLSGVKDETRKTEYECF
ncbi:Uncharacterised protein [Klebsiella michiganensis]|nr:Uncharacterised protein [Klebsiella michiganensis]